MNHGASSGSLNINEGEHYETYSTSGTDIIYFDMATQAELDAIKEDVDEALQQVVDDGIKDQMTATEPPKELTDPEE